LLKKLTRPFVLRRLKRDVLADLPPITEVQLDVHLSEDEALRYAFYAARSTTSSILLMASVSTRSRCWPRSCGLRRFCCHPALVFPDAPSECAKVDAFLELVEELRENQHRALVFSQFVDFLGLIRERLHERGISYEYLDGSTPKAERQARVRPFSPAERACF